MALYGHHSGSKERDGGDGMKPRKWLDAEVALAHGYAVQIKRGTLSCNRAAKVLAFSLDRTEKAVRAKLKEIVAGIRE